MYQNDDYLAKRIAEETVKAQKMAHNKMKIKRGRFILTGVCIALALLGGFSGRGIGIGSIVLCVTVIYWIYTALWLKKHDTK